MQQITMQFILNGKEFENDRAEAISDVFESVKQYLLKNKKHTVSNIIKNEADEMIGWFRIEPPKPFELEYLADDYRCSN